MLHSNINENLSPHMQVLAPDQRFKIIQAAKTVLERTGCRVVHEEALSMMKKAGASVTEDRVKVPRHLVEDCLRKAPRGIVIYDRDGNPAMDLGGTKSYYGTSTGSPNTKDALTGEIHPTRVEDIAIGAKVADALPNISWVMPFGSSQDVDSSVSDLYEFEAVVHNTSKPLAFCGFSPKSVEIVFEMAALVAGGKDKLREKPFILAYPEPISPLLFPEDVVDKILLAADWGIPQITTGAGQMGATSPVTLAGTLVQMLAESMMSAVLIQLRNSGAPMFIASNFGMFDMRSGLNAMASPECCLQLGALAEIARDFGLPSWGCAGASDSKCIDSQAGMESAFSILAQGLSGINLIHDVGYLDMGMVCSAEMLVLGNEMVGMARRFAGGIEINDETLACDVIDTVGPGGNYLQQQHTMNHFKACWYPELATRSSFNTWEKSGKKTMADRCKEKTREIVETHHPAPLDESIAEAVRVLRQKGEEEMIGKKSLATSNMARAIRG